MTRKTLLAGAAMCGLVLATAVWGAAGDAGKDWHYDNMGAMRTPEVMADHLMDHFDLNRDGKITKDEITRALKQETAAHFAAMGAHHVGVVTADERYQTDVAHLRGQTAEMFKHLDKNGDGKLTPDEIAAAGPMIVHRPGWTHGHRGSMDEMGDDEDIPMPGSGGTQP
jgi:hypothetical protein